MSNFVKIVRNYEHICKIGKEIINHKDFVIDDYYLLNKDYCLINVQNKYKIYVLNRYKKAVNKNF